jgi:hypothetical protein
MNVKRLGKCLHYVPPETLHTTHQRRQIACYDQDTSGQVFEPLSQCRLDSFTV